MDKTFSFKNKELRLADDFIELNMKEVGYADIEKVSLKRAVFGVAGELRITPRGGKGMRFTYKPGINKQVRKIADYICKNAGIDLAHIQKGRSRLPFVLLPLLVIAVGLSVYFGFFHGDNGEEFDPSYDPGFFGDFNHSTVYGFAYDLGHDLGRDLERDLGYGFDHGLERDFYDDFDHSRGYEDFDRHGVYTPSTFDEMLVREFTGMLLSMMPEMTPDETQLLIRLMTEVLDSLNDAAISKIAVHELSWGFTITNFVSAEWAAIWRVFTAAAPAELAVDHDIEARFYRIADLHQAGWTWGDDNTTGGWNSLEHYPGWNQREVILPINGLYDDIIAAGTTVILDAGTYVLVKYNTFGIRDHFIIIVE